MATAQKLFLQHVAQTSTSPPMVEIAKAKGVYVWDTKGKKYIDLISGISVNNLGHNPKPVVKAIQKQAETYLHPMVYGEYIVGPQNKLALKLAQKLAPIDNFYFVNSGSEAIEGAMKLAKRATGRSNFVAFKNAYHGSTQGAMSLMENEHHNLKYKPLLPGVTFLDYNTTEKLDAISTQTAAVFLECVQSEAGYLPGKQSFIKAVAERCNAVGALLVVDEIQTGMGRTGAFCAFEQYKITPDIICMAKALGGGMPLGVFAAKKELMHQLAENPILGHMTTFGGHPVNCAAGLAAIKMLDKSKVVKAVNAKEKQFKKQLKHPLIKKITGKGLMLAIHLDSFERVDQSIQFLQKNGVLTDWFLFAPHAIRLSPPLIITEKQINKVCNLILESLDAQKIN